MWTKVDVYWGLQPYFVQRHFDVMRRKWVESEKMAVYFTIKESLFPAQAKIAKHFYLQQVTKWEPGKQAAWYGNWSARFCDSIITCTTIENLHWAAFLGFTHVATWHCTLDIIIVVWVAVFQTPGLCRQAACEGLVPRLAGHETDRLHVRVWFQD